MEDCAIQVLHFKINATRFCLNLQYVNKILPLAQLEFVPNAPVYLQGLLNLAGTSLPVIDLGLKLGLPRLEAYTIDTPVLCCTNEDEKLCYVVDAILTLQNLNKTKIQMEKKFKNSPFIGTVVSEDKQLSLLLRNDYLFSLDFTAGSHHE